MKPHTDSMILGAALYRALHALAITAQPAGHQPIWSEHHSCFCSSCCCQQGCQTACMYHLHCSARCVAPCNGTGSEPVASVHLGWSNCAACLHLAAWSGLQLQRPLTAACQRQEAAHAAAGCCLASVGSQAGRGRWQPCSPLAPCTCLL